MGAWPGTRKEKYAATARIASSSVISGAASATAGRSALKDMPCGRAPPTFEKLLSPKDIDPPSYEELATLNAELRLKSPEAIARLLDAMEGSATWDAQSRRFVCTDSGWVTTVQALDYYVDDPGLWQQRAEAASKAAIDDEMGEWERAVQNTVREHFTALLGAATSGVGSRPAGDSAGAEPSTVQEAPDDVISHSPAS